MFVVVVVAAAAVVVVVVVQFLVVVVVVVVVVHFRVFAVGRCSPAHPPVPPAEGAPLTNQGLC